MGSLVGRREPARSHSRAAAANHLGSRKVSSRTGHPLQVYKSGSQVRKRQRTAKAGVKVVEFPKEKKKLKRKVFESTADMAAALHPPFAS